MSSFCWLYNVAQWLEAYGMRLLPLAGVLERFFTHSWNHGRSLLTMGSLPGHQMVAILHSYLVRSVWSKWPVIISSAYKSLKPNILLFIVAIKVFYQLLHSVLRIFYQEMWCFILINSIMDEKLRFNYVVIVGLLFFWCHPLLMMYAEISL